MDVVTLVVCSDLRDSVLLLTWGDSGHREMGAEQEGFVFCTTLYLQTCHGKPVAAELIMGILRALTM